MKKSSILLLLTLASFCFIIFILSCSSIETTAEGGKTIPFETITFDGCEYLVIEVGQKYSNNYALAITHKGNCKNH